MTASDVVDVGRDGLWVLLQTAGPVMLVALFVGLAISLFQALTQIQEMTLAFVPKILVVFTATIILLPYMIGLMTSFMTRLVDRMVSLGLPPPV